MSPSPESPSPAPAGRRADPPNAWIVCGAPGSGKSVLGGELAATLPATLLDQDVVTGPLTAVITRLVGAAPDDLDDPRVRTALGGAAYDALLATAADNLRAGNDVVLVAPFSWLRGSGATPERLRPLAPATLRIVWTTCPHGELLRRLADRAAPRDRRKLADPGRLLATTATPPVLPHVAVDTTAPLEGQVQAALTAPIVAHHP